MAVSPFVRFRGVWNSTFEGGKSGITTLYYAPEQLRSGRKSVAWVHAKRPPRQRVCSSRQVATYPCPPLLIVNWPLRRYSRSILTSLVPAQTSSNGTSEIGRASCRERGKVSGGV